MEVMAGIDKSAFPEGGDPTHNPSPTAGQVPTSGGERKNQGQNGFTITMMTMMTINMVGTSFIMRQ
ncbi:hypothetical protein PPNSA23_01860 [Phyllobacterium phragmitis]|uniref:Uncharacterized protein n=1 Tax=Phyllobacterium phragmitis TaxID=2670329 RepID=A0ABQ0GUA5_9HYPH